MNPKPIEVNGIKYSSARAAARYIVNQESQLGIIRKENTIAKELKRTFSKNGGHSWRMYGRYLVICKD